ncbi:MAG TPA: hypothetical protein PKL37_15585 [Panacibacter sp.]|nr:hypothetical protein [Panacibacter sp.]
MKAFFIAAISLLISTIISGQTVTQSEHETAEQFVSRSMPENAQLTHKVLSVKWNNSFVIMAFFEQSYKLSQQDDPSQEEQFRIIATMFLQTALNQYRIIHIDSIDGEGSKPVIESAFFANTDKDPATELVLIVSWQQRHRDVNGTLYGTYVYDNLFKDAESRLTHLKKISEKLSGGCECEWSDGTHKKARFKTAADIRTELKHMGLKQ